MSSVVKSISFVTGASGGFGRAICESIASRNPSNSNIFVITGRNQQELDVTSKIIKEKSAESTVIQKVFDFKIRDSVKLGVFITELYDLVNSTEASTLNFYHNAATLGPLAYIGTDLEQPLDVIYDDEFHVNCSSCFTMTSSLISRIYSGFFPSVKTYNIINVSSLAGIQAFDSWSVYCSQKAAREMFFNTLVLEIEKRNKRLIEAQSPVPSISILNYAPGPLDTQMQKNIREDQHCDPEISSYYRKLFEDGNLLQPLTSAAKLVQLVEERSYKSGAHIDFYDI